jgi:predicted dinucleotide-binding enzyme
VAEKGIGITSAQYLPGTRLVRAFNAMSFRKFEADSQRPGDRVAVPIAGDDPEALKVAAGLVHDAGFDSVAVPLARAGEFAVGTPLFLQELTASELRQRLGVAQ